MTIRSFLRDFPSPRTTRLGLLLGVPLSILLGPRLVAWAGVELSKTWNPGDTLTANDLNKNFSDLKAAIDKPKATNPSTGASVSTSAVTCGLTAPMSAAVGGYDGIKSKCQNTCGNSPTAHLCSAEEMIRSATLGLPPTANVGRYSTAIGSETVGGDCEGWTLNEASYTSAIWQGNKAGPRTAPCNNQTSFFCCD